MSEFKQYKRTEIVELRPYKDGEAIPWNVWNRMSLDYLPKVGDMIARNPNNHDQQWLITKEDFEDRFEPLYEDEITLDIDLIKVSISMYDPEITQPPFQTIQIDEAIIANPLRVDGGKILYSRLMQACVEKGYRMRFYSLSTNPDYVYDVVVTVR